MAARPDSKASEEKDKPRKRGKGVLIGAIASVLVAACVAAGWYYTRPVGDGDADGAQISLKPIDAIFVNLEPFTVNLADEGGERLAQVALVLEMGSKDAQAALSKNLPVVRNSILLLLSSQYTKTLLTLEGKLALADAVALRTGSALGWKPHVPEEKESEQENPSPARKLATHKPGKRPYRELQPNPVMAAHFSQLLVQ